MSNSMNHFVPVQYPISLSAVWHDFFGLNPCELSLEHGFVDGFQYHAPDFLHLFIASGWDLHSTLPHFPNSLRNR